MHLQTHLNKPIHMGVATQGRMLGAVLGSILEIPPIMPMSIFNKMRILAIAQGAYFLVGGLWPLLHLSSFEAVTGPKVDDFLVRSVAGILVWMGVLLSYHALRRLPISGLGWAALGISLVLSLVALIGAVQGTLRWVYFIDGSIHLLFAACWLMVLLTRNETGAREAEEPLPVRA